MNFPTTREPADARRVRALIGTGLLVIAGGCAVLLLKHPSAAPTSTLSPAVSAHAGPSSGAGQFTEAVKPVAPPTHEVFRRTLAATGESVETLSALRAWAAQDPEAALLWARGKSGAFRLAALTAALEGAAKQPERATRLARDFFRDEPDRISDCGTALLGALVRDGAFASALDFLGDAPVSERGEWHTMLFSAWAQREPAFAAELAGLFSAKGLGGRAFESVFQSWATAAPADAWRFAVKLPTGSARAAAIGAIFPRWALQDPDGLSAALPLIAEPAEHDTASVALVCSTDSANRPTSNALTIAEGIQDLEMRRRALAHVLLEWTQTDPSAVAQYIADNPALSSSDREALLSALKPPPPDPT